MIGFVFASVRLQKKNKPVYPVKLEPVVLKVRTAVT